MTGATAGLVLAAGAGTRFGGAPGSKLLADVDGRPLVEQAIAAACAVEALERVAVVLGAGAEELLERVEIGRAEPVMCEQWERGQAWSLRRGVEALAGAGTVIVTLGDAPLVTPAVIERFVGEPGGTRAVYRGRTGHPVVLGPEQLEAIGALTGDEGARGLLRGGPEIECSELCSGRDVDTYEDLEAIRRETRAVI